MRVIKTIKEKDFPETWPFTFQKGKIVNENGAIYVVNCADSKKYALTGFTKTMGKELTGRNLIADITPIWKDDPNPNGGGKMPLGNFIRIGINLAKGKINERLK